MVRATEPQQEPCWALAMEPQWGSGCLPLLSYCERTRPHLDKPLRASILADILPLLSILGASRSLPDPVSGSEGSSTLALCQAQGNNGLDERMPSSCLPSSPDPNIPFSHLSSGFFSTSPKVAEYPLPSFSPATHFKVPTAASPGLLLAFVPCAHQVLQPGR